MNTRHPKAHCFPNHANNLISIITWHLLRYENRSFLILPNFLNSEKHTANFPRCFAVSLMQYLIKFIKLPILSPSISTRKAHKRRSVRKHGKAGWHEQYSTSLLYISTVRKEGGREQKTGKKCLIAQMLGTRVPDEAMQKRGGDGTWK